MSMRLEQRINWDIVPSHEGKYNAEFLLNNKQYRNYLR